MRNLEQCSLNSVQRSEDSKEQPPEKALNRHIKQLDAKSVVSLCIRLLVATVFDAPGIFSLGSSECKLTKQSESKQFPYLNLKHFKINFDDLNNPPSKMIEPFELLRIAFRTRSA